METLPRLDKGDFIFYEHKNFHNDSKVKEGKHMYIVLHSYTHPYGTYLIAPITSSEGKLPNHVVKLKKEDYPECLDRDSYIDLSFITVADKKRFEPCKVKDNKGIRSIVVNTPPKLKKEDLLNMDLKLLLVLELGNTVDKITELILEKKLLKLDKEISIHIQNINKCMENSDHPSNEELKGQFNQIQIKLKHGLDKHKK